MTNAAGLEYGTAMAWSGSEFAIAWKDNRPGWYEIYFGRVSAEGVKVGADVRLTNDAANPGDPSLVWTGSEFGVSWWDARDGSPEIYFARLSPAGVRLGDDVRLTNEAGASQFPSLVWTGSEYGVSWTYDANANAEVYLARISANGAPLGAPVRVTSTALYYSSLAWTGSEYGVSWWDDRDGNDEIYFARVSADGAKIGDDVRLTNDAGGSNNPALVWTGREYGVTWGDFRDGNDIYFARVSADGVKVGEDERVTNAQNLSQAPSLVWTGSEYGVLWQNGGGESWDAYLTRVSADGVRVGADIRASSVSGSSNGPSMAWTGSEYGVSWTDSRNDDPDIYFARLAGDCE